MKEDNSEKKTVRQRLEAWLKNNYSIRYNNIKYCVEFAPVEKNKPLNFQDLTDRDMFTMLRQIDEKTSLKVNERLLYQVLNSSFAETFNPIKSYFENLNFKKEEITRSEIDHMADFVILKHNSHTNTFKRVFRSWLVSSVANSLTPNGCQNQTCLVFTGSQGKGKTTFLNSICPPALTEYLYTSNLDLKSKDTFIMLGQNFIINIDDQLEVLFKQDAETMKTLITQREKKIRLPHARFVQNVPRIANFVGSLNHNQFLRDQSGNRRFLPFEVKAFLQPDEKISFDIDKVWFEAYQEYKDCIKNKKPYWLSKEELEELFGGFEEFYIVTPEEEILQGLFEIPTEKNQLTSDFKKLMVTEIERIIIQSKAAQKINLKSLGQILKKLGAIEVTRGGGKRCYWIRQKSLVEIESEQQYNPMDIPKFEKEVNF